MCLSAFVRCSKSAHMRFVSCHDFDEKLKRVQMAGNEMHQIRNLERMNFNKDYREQDMSEGEVRVKALAAAARAIVLRLLVINLTSPSIKLMHGKAVQKMEWELHSACKETTRPHWHSPEPCRGYSPNHHLPPASGPDGRRSGTPALR